MRELCDVAGTVELSPLSFALDINTEIDGQQLVEPGTSLAFTLQSVVSCYLYVSSTKLTTNY